MATDLDLRSIDTDEMKRRLMQMAEDEEASRLLLFVAGGALALFGLTRLSIPGAIVAAAGGGLVYLGSQQRSLAQISRGAMEMTRRTRALPTSIDVEKTVIVHRPVEEVYAFWRNFSNLGRFMSHIESVRCHGEDDRWSTWRAQLFQGSPVVEWEAEMIEDVRNERIAWRSLPDSDVETNGTVRFEPVMGGRATEVRLIMEYIPPMAGAFRLLNPAISQMVKEDLRRFKHMLEDGTPHGTGTSPHLGAGPTTGTSHNPTAGIPDVHGGGVGSAHDTGSSVGSTGRPSTRIPYES